MKKTSLVIIISLSVFLLRFANAQQYQIKAELSGFKNQTQFYLKDNTAGVIIDSAKIINGKFTLKGKSTSVKNLWLYARPNKQFLYTNLLIGADIITVSGNAKDFPRDLKITGSASQNVANILNSQTKALWKTRDSITDILMPLVMGNVQNDSTRLISKSLSKQLKKTDSVLDQITLNFIAKNINSYAALQELYWKRSLYKKQEFENLFYKVQAPYKDSGFGKRIANYIKVGEALKKGDDFYDFEASDINGKKLRIQDYKGKYILLDFTETYCGPCVLAADELKKIAESYAKQVQIITFYAETNKKTMQEGLNRDKPTWPCVWDGKGIYSEIALKYGVQGFPTFVIINPEGKIVAKFSGYGKDENGKGNVEQALEKVLKISN